MSDVPSSDSNRINEAVDRFERAWKAGVTRPIEDFLAGLDEPRRRTLLHELLRVELAMRDEPTRSPARKSTGIASPKIMP